MRIALIAHDRKKHDIVQFVLKHRDAFSRHTLVATGTTGSLVQERTGLEVHRYLSGPMGGDQQIGSEIALGTHRCRLLFAGPSHRSSSRTGRSRTAPPL